MLHYKVTKDKVSSNPPLKMALKEAGNDQRSDMDELVIQHEEVMRY